MKATRWAILFLAMLALLGVNRAGEAQEQILVVSGDSGETFGWSVSGFSDLDDDGLNEFLVGVPRGGDGAGCVEIFGGRGGIPYATILPPGNQELFGSFVGPAGDFDKDGTPDVIVGAKGKGGGGSNPGQIVIACGATGDALLTARGAYPGGYFGHRAIALGDVTDDGVGDFAVGEPGTWGTGGGSVWLIDGATGDHIADKSLTFDTAHGHRGTLGWALCALGDIDGDGKTDYAAGAPAAESKDGDRAAGRVLIVSGGTGEILETIIGKVRRVQGHDAPDQLGASLACADVTGDGDPDLLIGGLGMGGYVLVYTADGDKELALIPAPDGIGSFGRSLAVVGDIDGRPGDEIAVGSTNRVDVFTVAGGEAGHLHRVDGEQYDDFGYCISACGDLGGGLGPDGVPDLLVSAWGTNRAMVVAMPTDLAPPPPIPAVKTGAVFTRSGPSLGTKARGSLSLKSKKNKISMKFSFKRLPADGTYNLYLRDGIVSDTFSVVAAVVASGGKAKVSFKEKGQMPPELDLEDLAQLGGRDMELRNGSGETVMKSVVPYFTQTESVKMKPEFVIPPASPYQEARVTAKLQWKGSKGSTKISVKVKGVPDDVPMTLFAEKGESGSGVWLPVADFDEKGKIKIDTAKGEPMPFDLDTFWSMAHSALKVQTPSGETIATTDPDPDPDPAPDPDPDPEPEVDLPDWKVTDIDLEHGWPYGFEQFHLEADVKNKGAAAAGNVNLAIYLYRVVDIEDPSTWILVGEAETRVYLDFPPDTEHRNLPLPWIDGSFPGAEVDMAVKIVIDPTTSANPTGEYVEEKEDNNTRVEIFTWDGDGYDEIG